jgi:peptidoglycan/LPS O-acetylase OafA/YrhL
MGTDTRIDSILFGCALALGANPMLDRTRPTSSTLRYRLMPLAIAVLLFTFLYRAPWFRETLRYTLQGMALTPLFVLAMREPSWGLFRVLNLPFLRHLGVLSYSLYLIHHVALYFFEAQLPHLNAVPRALLALAVSLALAEAIQRFIERPCARLRRRLAHTSWLSAATATAGAAGPLSA